MAGEQRAGRIWHEIMPEHDQGPDLLKSFK